MQLPGGDAVSRVKNMQTHTNSRAQSNIAVNETGGPDRRQVHAALGASVRAAGESNKALKKGRIKGEMDGSGEGEEGAGGGQWWILLIAIVIPPLQKMATSIKSLMIPALCHGG